MAALSEPYGNGPLGRFRVQQHLEEKLVRLLEPGGAWFSHKSRGVLAAVARALIAMADHRGVTWAGEERVAARTGFRYSSVHHALAAIAGVPGRPGALFSRRHLNDGEAYERDGESIVRPTYFYFADLSAASPRLTSIDGAATGARGNDLLSRQVKVVRPAGCSHVPSCHTRAECSRRSMPEYFASRATS